MLLIVLVSIFVAASAQQDLPTTAPAGHQHGNGTGNGTHHHHKENPEFEMWSFTFESYTGYMVVLKDTDCYMWRITDNERKNIHTDAGLRAVEIRVVGEIEDAIYTTIDKVLLSSHVLQKCGRKATKFYIVH